MSSIKFVLPGGDYFHNPPPSAAYPPTAEHPFHIPPHLYHSLLDVRVPLSIAAIYTVTVHTLNGYASKTKPPTPYGFAKTRAFYCFVVAHNLFLAVYSLWTFIGMASAVSRSIPSIMNDHGIARTVHSLCRIHEGDDHSRGLWQEGLAFYGWIFYLSKFYEVLDTVIILAKGRKSSTLQTYHHAGAMICMWLGIRFMSPPIFLFVLFNSFIHTLMYTYYTLSALRIRVPNAIKRSLTTMQITQFVVGASAGAIWLLVEYIPPALEGISSSSDKASEMVDAAGQILGERRKEMQSCLTDVGSAYAVVSNIMYLMPLTYLFVMFFINSYLGNNRRPAESKVGEKNLKQTNGKAAH